MSKGVTRKKVMGEAGHVVYKDAPNWDFIYDKSTVIHPDFVVGDTVNLPDGREYTYALSSAACSSGHACETTQTGYTAYTAFAVSAAVGATEVTVPAATHAALVADELRNGYIVIFDGSTGDVQFRGIIGNDASILNVAFKVYLDGPLTEAVVASTSACESYKSPFAGVKLSADATKAKLGVPAVKIAATGYYFWVQTKGNCFVSPQASVAANSIGVYWRHDGSIEGEIATGSKNAGLNSTQYAGVTLEGNAAGNGPLLLLK